MHWSPRYPGAPGQWVEMCGQVRLLLAETLATALLLTLASLAPTAPAVSWGATYTLATLLAGQGSVLNPALSLAMVAARQVAPMGVSTPHRCG